MKQKSETKEVSSYSYINKEISQSERDYIGFDAQKDALDNAIDSGARMVGIIADYGYGKSSLVNMLTADNTKYEPTIKINMWDGLQKNNEDKGESKEMKLEKSFLYQLAKGSGKKDLTKHVTKRLSENSGFISFTFRSRKMWIWLVVALFFFVAGLVLRYTGLTLPYSNITDSVGSSFVLSMELGPMCYFISAIFLAVGLAKYNAAFSSWRTEGHRQFDSSDVFSVFQEIIETVKSKKTRIILIEDLDRIKETGSNGEWTANDFIKLLYRLSNYCSGSKFCFVVAIKQEKKEEKEYNKFFDYMLSLKAVHIGNFSEILNSLLQEKAQEITKMFDGDNNTESHTVQSDTLDSEICGQFSYLIRGKKLTVRDLKHRLNDAIVLYKTIQSKKYNNESGKPNMVTCCAVAYLKSEYEKDYYNLVEHELLFEQAIKTGYLQRIDKNIGKEYKVQNLITSIKRDFINDYALTPTFINEISNLIIDGIIDDNYREYFFSYPKGSYIKSASERRLENILLFGESCEQEKLDEIVEGAFSKNGDCPVAQESLNQLIQLKKTLPTVILKNERLLEYCFKTQKDQTVNMLVENYSWENADTGEVVRVLSAINKYKFPGKKQLLESYARELYSTITHFHDNAINCRLSVVKEFGNDIILFKNMFIETKVPCLTAAEAVEIPDPNLIFELLTESKCSNALLVALSEKVVSMLNEKQKTLLTAMIKRHIKSVVPTIETVIAIVKLFTVNLIVDDDIFEFVSRYERDAIEAFEQYLGVLNEPLDESYCRTLAKYDVGIKLNDNVLNSLFTNKFYDVYLRHCVALDKFTRLLYNFDIFNEQCVDKLFSTSAKLFVNYRFNLLKQPEKVRRQYKNLYLSPYPFLTETEAKKITVAECMATRVLTRISAHIDEFKSELPYLIRSANDAYDMTMYLLRTQPSYVKYIFQAIPFEKVGFGRLTSSEKEEIQKQYENVCPLNNISALIDYAKITGDLTDRTEEKIIGFIDSAADSDQRNRYIANYIDLLDRLGAVSEKTIEVLIKYGYLGKMPNFITVKLREKKSYEQYIVGRTLWDSEFVYDRSIPLDEYIKAYVDSEEMFNYMKECQPFLEDVYNARKFDVLFLPQLMVYNRWGQTIELLRAFMRKCQDYDRRKEYIMNIKNIDSLDDSDSIQSYICNSAFDDLLSDKEVRDHIYSLLWQEHPGKRAAFTRYVNSLAI